MLGTIKLFFRKLFEKKKPLELSYTKVSTYRFCPWKYKLVYENGLRVPPNPYIALGLTIHRTLEGFHKNGHNDYDFLMEIYNRVWVNEGFQNPQQAMHFYDKGKKMLDQYFQFSSERKSEVIAVEKEFQFPLGRHVVRGIIDRIDRLPDDTYEVIDYKTHAEMWEQSRIDEDLQLTLYSLGCQKALGIEPAALSYFFLAHNKVVTTHRTKQQEEDALENLRQAADEMEGKSLKPDLSKCPKCDFRNICVHSTAKGVAGVGSQGRV